MVGCGLGRDRGVGGNTFGGEVCIVGQRVERSSVEGERDLNLGFVGVAVYESSAPQIWLGHYCEKGLKILMGVSDTKMQSKHAFLNSIIYTEPIVHVPLHIVLSTYRRTWAPVNALIFYWQTTFANASFVEMLPVWKPSL